MTRLPLSIVGGYLGAGKTTLINHLLTADHGHRLAVLVNDFGAINIDATLLKSACADTIELTNGCVCCTMSGDLFFAIGDMLDRGDRPDHLIVEASGIADPSKIAAVAIAEPDLRYAGILTVVDGLNGPAYLGDPLISDQIAAQIGCADLIAVSKTPADDGPVAAALTGLGVQAWVAADDLAAIAGLFFDDAVRAPPPANTAPAAHPSYVSWSLSTPGAMAKKTITARLSRRPAGILRVKAVIPAGPDAFWEVHVVGAHHTVRSLPSAQATGVVALGLSSTVTCNDIERWWMG